MVEENIGGASAALALRLIKEFDGIFIEFAYEEDTANAVSCPDQVPLVTPVLA